MDKTKLKGYLEFFAHLPHLHLDKDLNVLLEAMDRSQIHTFGWPVGIVLHTEEDKPEPFEQGLRCLVDTGRHYDYWTLNRNGDFYLLKSLFEDIHDHGDKTGGGHPVSRRRRPVRNRRNASSRHIESAAVAHARAPADV